jgi:hypothetical protein
MDMRIDMASLLLKLSEHRLRSARSGTNGMANYRKSTRSQQVSSAQKIRTFLVVYHD